MLEMLKPNFPFNNLPALYSSKINEVGNHTGSLYTNNIVYNLQMHSFILFNCNIGKLFHVQ